jgi:hypothetical protein
MNPTFDSMMGAMGFKRVKSKKCRICRQEYQPTRPLQPTCGEYSCNVAYALTVAEKSARKRVSDEKALKKAERKEIKARKEKIKTRADWMKETQSAVNAYRRALFAEEGCISCGNMNAVQYHAGHYVGRGRQPALALEELNIWKQCSQCNCDNHGATIPYRQALVKRIGLEKVEWLEGPHEPKKYTIAELKALRDHYRAKLRELTREKACAT